MTPAARAAAAIEILDRWQQGPEQLDRLLAAWGRRNRFAGSGDRRAIADLVYDTLRRWRSSVWVSGAADTARSAVIGCLRQSGTDPAPLFTGEGYAPAPLDGDERSPRCLADAPRPVRLDFPDWLAKPLAAVPDAALLALRERAPLDLRANLLKTTREEARIALQDDGVAADPVPLSPTALRVREGARGVSSSAAFRSGLVEVMDASSQAVADYVQARPGDSVLDFCAGAGGKALALAAAMRNRGSLLAHDADAGRLSPLPERARRAGARVRCLPPGGWREFAGSFNIVLVDAPCSGSGTWRRTPDAKWRLSAPALERLTTLQDAVLAEAADGVAPGGRLVYATCSLLACENEQRLQRFLDSHRNFAIAAPALCLTPLDGGDGFYAARLLRSD